MTDTPALHVYFFGPLQMIWDEEPLPLPRSSKARALLTYLIFHHHKEWPRDLLAGLFWGERPDAAARRALSQSLWQIRHALGPASDRLEAERDAVAFSLRPGDRWDVKAFEDHLAAADRALSSDDARVHLSQAAALYRSDLLEGCYADWVLLERERLREL
jgi:DNA-binding SARP family transcriptional activator